MDTPEHVWFLMARNLGGEATPEEQDELMQLLQQHPQWMQQYDMMRSLWKPVAGKQEASDEQDRIRQILQLAAEESGEAPVIPMHNRGKRRRFLIMSAAAAIIILAVSWTVIEYVLGNGSLARPVQQEIVAQKGSKTRTLLPDGSTVWLNAGSKISYPSNFSGLSREVTLQGEAYFDVVKQPDRPFIVHAEDINITVLGTAFNVKSYAEDNTVETTLIRGLVQITRANTQAQEPILLQPNQKIVLRKNNPVPEQTRDILSPANLPHDATAKVLNLDSTKKEHQLIETAWIYNRLEFRGDHFDELALKLERWYNIEIQFDDETVKKLTFNGSLESESVEQAFQALKAAVPFRYEIKENEIHVSSLQ